ncbi:hypothetical protein KIW84_044145 [Lathyrus oleraceus]|uniref:Uncharacterized protein n=1 Tax=Pisum sativum TaxID=3888 RepID=A0A9D4XFH5_PEA|nr:hypothetical protein KIW84_044145 [Pisum sativum]
MVNQEVNTVGSSKRLDESAVRLKMDAVGVLTYAHQYLEVQLKESWYEKLQRWDDALKAYTSKASEVTSAQLVLDTALGRMRFLAALARWEELSDNEIMLLEVTEIVMAPSSGLFYQFAEESMINHAMGASGVVSKKCKNTAAEHGQTILDLLLSEAHADRIKNIQGMIRKS